ncbi:hypothetical protein [Methylotenera sp. L2L1]|uniref:hypothetical protein n=1 Tax=Methylotenera sp. L2L1 TaxID=1502770 RepID=UPI00056720AC|nr:hypothetical protein [Methylotenera sp. L2L1]
MAYICSEKSDLSSDIYEFFYFMPTSNGCQVLADTIKENLLVNEKLRDSIELLNLSLVQYQNSIKWFTPYVPIFAVLLGSFAAYSFTRYHWAHAEKKKKEAESFNKISNLISEIEEIAVEYWTKDHSQEDIKNEVKLKSKFKLLTRYVKYVEEKREPKLMQLSRYLKIVNVKQGSIKKELEQFNSKLYDLTTGDEFESIHREAAKSTASRVSFLCAEMKGTLLVFC